MLNVQRISRVPAAYRIVIEQQSEPLPLFAPLAALSVVER